MVPTSSEQLWDLFVCLQQQLQQEVGAGSITELMQREQKSFVIPCSAFKYIHLFDTDAVVYFNQVHMNKGASPGAFAYSVFGRRLPDVPYRCLNSFNVNFNFASKMREHISLPESKA